MDLNFNFKIINSFNKEDKSQQNKDDSFDDFSTVNKNQNKNIVVTNSANVNSLTNDIKDDSINYQISSNLKHHSFLRDIFVAILGAVVGTVLGAIITYLILGIN